MPQNKTSMAVLLTCFNRKDKTVKCLQHLFHALDAYNAKHDGEIEMKVYLTDDACTDGTAEAVRQLCGERELQIIRGDGSLFWAGGMRAAWREALKEKSRWQFYLLLNDDTIVMENVFDELFNAHHHSLAKYSKAGIYSGITCDPEDKNRITYSGDVFETSARGTLKRLGPADAPQLIHMTNANILLVDKSVVEKIGILPDCFEHACADNDYSMMARRNGIPAMITAGVCGLCADDHETKEEECLRLMSMSLSERKKYVRHPLHSDRDYLLLIKRNIPRKYPISWAMRKIRLYCPAVYHYINKKRGLY